MPVAIPERDKDPQAVLDYVIDWTAWLQVGETIVASVVAVPLGITLNSQPNTATTVTAWLSGGTVGRSYIVTSHITTNLGRQDDRSIRVNVVER